MTSAEGDVNIEARDSVVVDVESGVKLMVDGVPRLEVDQSGTSMK